MQRCPFCAITWVDEAGAAAGTELTALERRRLIAALLSRRHVILSGPAGIGKRRLASALALSIAQGRTDRVCRLQGHPWWAARTGDVARYVTVQAEFNTWRLAGFLKSARHSHPPAAHDHTERDAGDYVACVERMSPAEIDFYFGTLACRLLPGTSNPGSSVPVRLIGTYDMDMLPDLSDGILRVAALVHLSNAPGGGARATWSESEGPRGATCCVRCGRQPPLGDTLLARFLLNGALTKELPPGAERREAENV